MISRRKSLALIGGGLVFAASVGAGTFLATRTPREALRPWQLAGQYKDPRTNALSYALLAPNPHNLQPWRAQLFGDDKIRIFRDLDTLLPETDPHSRQLTIGMGCFLELFRMAAAERGFSSEFSLFPDQSESFIAEITLSEGGEPDPLFAQVLERRSCKEPFTDQKPRQATLDQVSAFAELIIDEREVNAVKKITLDAFSIEYNHPPTLKESVDYMRFGKAEIEASPDGIDLGGPFLESLMLVGQLNREKQLDPNSMASKEGARMYDEMLNATPSYATITSKENNRVDQMEAGRRWIRLNLKTTELGLSLHPVSQALQEFPQMAEQYNKIHKILAPEGGTVQMLGRLGYGPEVSRSPRWPLEKRLLNG